MHFFTSVNTKSCFVCPLGTLKNFYFPENFRRVVFLTQRTWKSTYARDQKENFFFLVHPSIHSSEHSDHRSLRNKRCQRLSDIRDIQLPPHCDSQRTRCFWRDIGTWDTAWRMPHGVWSFRWERERERERERVSERVRERKATAKRLE